MLTKEKESEHPPRRKVISNGPFNKFQYRNYHVTSSLSKETQLIDSWFITGLTDGVLSYV